jgi:hypothetical protein
LITGHWGRELNLACNKPWRDVHVQVCVWEGGGWEGPELRLSVCCVLCVCVEWGRCCAACPRW